MQTQSRHHQVKAIGCAIALTLTALSCSPEPDELPQVTPLAPGETYGDWGAPVPTTAATAPATRAPTTSPPESDDVELAAATTPEALSLVDEEQTTNDGYNRTAADGIKLTGGPTNHDFGWGKEPSFEALGSHAGGHAGVTVPVDAETTDVDILDTVGWAHSASTFVVIIATSDDVDSVRLLGSQGSIDNTRPLDGIAIAAVRAGSSHDITIEALDAAGNILGTCASDGSFIECS